MLSIFAFDCAQLQQNFSGCLEVIVLQYNSLEQFTSYTANGAYKVFGQFFDVFNMATD